MEQSVYSFNSYESFDNNNSFRHAVAASPRTTTSSPVRVSFSEGTANHSECNVTLDRASSPREPCSISRCCTISRGQNYGEEERIRPARETKGQDWEDDIDGDDLDIPEYNITSNDYDDRNDISSPVLRAAESFDDDTIQTIAHALELVQLKDRTPSTSRCNGTNNVNA
ncbi:MAG: hypothetical protein ACRDL7_16435, partial [Gaiellaceae bacterium]